MVNAAPHIDPQLLQVYTLALVNTAAVTTGQAADRETLLQRLNEALATELASSLRNQHHHCQALVIHSHTAAREFLGQANQQLRHVELLAKRIVQLGGTPDFAAGNSGARTQAADKEGGSLSSMLRDNLLAEGLVIDNYRNLILFLRENDPTTRLLLEGILGVAEQHADELAETLVSSFQARITERNIMMPSLWVADDHSQS